MSAPEDNEPTLSSAADTEDSPPEESQAPSAATYTIEGATIEESCSNFKVTSASTESVEGDSFGEQDLQEEEVRPREFSTSPEVEGHHRSPSPINRDDDRSYSSSRHDSERFIERDYPEQSLYDKVLGGLFPSVSTAKLMSHPSYLRNRPEPRMNPGMSAESRRVMLRGYDLGFSAPGLRAIYDVIWPWHDMSLIISLDHKTCICCFVLYQHATVLSVCNMCIQYRW